MPFAIRSLAHITDVLFKQPDLGPRCFSRGQERLVETFPVRLLPVSSISAFFMVTLTILVLPLIFLELQLLKQAIVAKNTFALMICLCLHLPD
jgi:hypothetical protein